MKTKRPKTKAASRRQPAPRSNPKHTGRRPKRPSNPRIALFHEFMAQEALTLLRRCGAPANWGIEEAETLWWYAFWPSNYASSCTDPQISETVLSAKLKNLLSFDRMFYLSPDAVCVALPKLRKLLKKRLTSPEFSASIELGRRANEEAVWSMTADELSRELSGELGMAITGKVAEHARARVRELLGQP